MDNTEPTVSDTKAEPSNGDNNDTVVNDDVDVKEENANTNDDKANSDADSAGEGDAEEVDDSEGDHHRKLLISGLTKSVKEDDLITYFKRFGDVMHCDLKPNARFARSRGFAVILFKESNAVEKVQDARPHILDGKKVKTKRAVPKMERTDVVAFELAENKKRLYVGGIKDLKEEDLKTYFGTFGKILKINVMARKQTGRKKGFAFLIFENPEPVAKILENKNHTIKGTEVEVDKGHISTEEKRKWFQREKPKALDGRKLFVSGLKDTDIEVADLTTYFAKYGSIVRVEIVKKKNRSAMKTAHAFVEFNDYDPVDKVLIAKPHTIKGISVEVEKGLLTEKRETNEMDKRGKPRTRGPIRNRGTVPSGINIWARNNDIPGNIGMSRSKERFRDRYGGSRMAYRGMDSGSRTSFGSSRMENGGYSSIPSFGSSRYESMYSNQPSLYEMQREYSTLSYGNEGRGFGGDFRDTMSSSLSLDTKYSSMRSLRSEMEELKSRYQDAAYRLRQSELRTPLAGSSTMSAFGGGISRSRSFYERSSAPYGRSMYNRMM